MAGLSAARLRAALDFNPETGAFTRKVSGFNPRVQAGTRAGGLARDGYRYVRVDTTRYLEHRLAWFYVYGHWPSEIDHANGVKDDNRIANLRVATRTQNNANKALQRNNASGFKGVHFDKANQKWMAYLQVSGKFKNLGRFDSIEAAVEARRQEGRKTFGEFARS